MNNASSRRTHYAGDDLKPVKQQSAARGWLVPALLAMVTVSHVAAMAAGAWFQRDQDARLAAIEAAKPKRVEFVEPAPLTQWRCDDQERREYAHACFKRKQAELVKKINPILKGK
jgi:hypothetical protein